MRIPSLDRKVATAVLGLALVAGSGTGAVVHALTNGADARDTGDRTTTASPGTGSRSPSPSPSPSRSATASPTSDGSPAATPTPTPTELAPLASLTVTAGAVGPVQVGMTRAQALATGYVSANPNGPCDGGGYLKWRAPYGSSLDLITIPNGSISSIGISGREPRTRSGYGIGSTWGQLERLVEPPQANDYGQSGAYVYDTDLDAYIGFLFDAAPDELTESSKVVFMEVSRHRPPGLLRDGC